MRMSASTACTAQRRADRTDTSLPALDSAGSSSGRSARPWTRPLSGGFGYLESPRGCRETPRRFDYRSRGRGGPTQESGMKYLCLVYSKDELGPTPQQTRDFLAFRSAAREAGVYVDAGALKPSESATTLRSHNGEIVLTDGPFAEI